MEKLSRRNHYIPIRFQENFLLEEQNFFVYNKNNNRCYTSKPKDLYVVKNQNIVKNNQTGEENDDLEKFTAKIDSKIKVINKIIEIVRSTKNSLKTPDFLNLNSLLSSEEILDLSLYINLTVIRNPTSKPHDKSEKKRNEMKETMLEFYYDSTSNLYHNDNGEEVKKEEIEYISDDWFDSNLYYKEFIEFLCEEKRDFVQHMFKNFKIYASIINDEFTNSKFIITDRFWRIEKNESDIDYISEEEMTNNVNSIDLIFFPISYDIMLIFESNEDRVPKFLIDHLNIKKYNDIIFNKSKIIATQDEIYRNSFKKRHNRQKRKL